MSLGLAIAGCSPTHDGPIRQADGLLTGIASPRGRPAVETDNSGLARFDEDGHDDELTAKVLRTHLVAPDSQRNLLGVRTKSAGPIPYALNGRSVGFCNGVIRVHRVFGLLAGGWESRAIDD